MLFIKFTMGTIRFLSATFQRDQTYPYNQSLEYELRIYLWQQSVYVHTDNKDVC